MSSSESVRGMTVLAVIAFVLLVVLLVMVVRSHKRSVSIRMKPIPRQVLDMCSKKDIVEWEDGELKCYNEDDSTYENYKEPSYCKGMMGCVEGNTRPPPTGF